MKISAEWLNTYLDSPVDADQIDRTLTNQGLPIESRQAVGASGGDVMLDVEVTSNRADCLSHIGLARDVAAGLGFSVVEPDCTLSALNGTEADPDAASSANVVNEEQSLCPLYTARVIRGVRIGPSPEWLVRRLEAVGQQSVNNVVDVTNFVLLELGQPLHAFDLNRLDGGRVVVRLAQKGETMVAIDGSRQTLDRHMLVIADAQKPVAIAGVMGGQSTRVTQETTDVLLESAVFDPVSVRRTSRALKLASDSSYRFERGVDPLAVQAASCRATTLICQLAHGQLARGVVCVGGSLPTPRSVVMRSEQCNRLLGFRLTPQRMVQLLDRLGFMPSLDIASGRITCAVPTRRMDVKREVDLIEEVARLHGFGAIPVYEKIDLVVRPVQRVVEARRQLGQVLVAHGYHEAIAFSFVNAKFGKPFVSNGQQAVTISDPQRRADPMLRPSVLSSLLLCRKANQDMGNTGVKLFECAATWTWDRKVIQEQDRLGMLCDTDDVQSDLRGLRGAVCELIERLAGRGMVALKPAEVMNLSPAARVVVDGEDVGFLGVIAPSCQHLFELQSPVLAADLDLNALLKRYPPCRTVVPLPKYPGIGRDLSIIVDESVGWDPIQQLVKATELQLLEDLRFMGVYRGKPIPKGKKSVSFRLMFRDSSATLRHEQVDPQIATVIKHLETHLGAKLRS